MRKHLFKTLFFLARKLRVWYFRSDALLEVFVAIGHIGKEKRSRSDQMVSQPEQSFSSLPSSSPELVLQEIQSKQQSVEKASEWTQSWCSSHQVESNEDIKRLMVLSRDFAQEGLLVAGHELYQVALKALSRRAESIPTLAGQIIGAKAAIHLGDVQKAQHFTKKLKRHFLLPNHHLYSLVAYVDIWSDGHTDVWSKGARDRSRTASIVKNRNVQVINKGPVGDDFVPDANALIARDLTPSSKDKLTPPSVGPNKTDIAYANGETLAWLRAQRPSRVKELLSPYQSVAAKAGTPKTLKALRMIQLREAALPNIFLAGSPNLAQIMALDLLAEGAASVYFAGTTFFLGSTPYRSDQYRFRVADGSTESPESLAKNLLKGLAGHNSWENRLVMKNLFLAGRIGGDKLFREALGYATHDYLLELEKQWSRV